MAFNIPIAIPQITMHEAGLDYIATSLKWKQETSNEFVLEGRPQPLHLAMLVMHSLLPVEAVLKQVGKNSPQDSFHSFGCAKAPIFVGTMKPYLPFGDEHLLCISATSRQRSTESGIVLVSTTYFKT